MGSKPVAELRHIHKVYGSGDTEVRAVNDLNLTVEAGDYIAVMGASGSGKSTAMNILGCLDRPSSGSYLLQGQQVDGLSDDALAILRNRCLGFVFQQFHLLGHLSAQENVELPMIYANVPAEERQQRAVEALQRVGLGQRLRNKPNQLSGGQQQRVAIARAIINRPALLLADEPTGALDEATADKLGQLLVELNAEENLTLITVTHSPDLAARMARTVKPAEGQIA